MCLKLRVWILGLGSEPPMSAGVVCSVCTALYGRRKCQPAGSSAITECEWEDYWETLDPSWLLNRQTLTMCFSVSWNNEIQHAWLYQHIYLWYTACLHFAQMTNTIANRNLLIWRPQIYTISSEETWTYKSTPTETATAVPAGCLMKHLFIHSPLYFCDYSFKKNEQDTNIDSVWPKKKNSFPQSEPKNVFQAQLPAYSRKMYLYGCCWEHILEVPDICI